MLTLTGTLLAGKYRVGARLGSGGMGEVYEATQEDLGRRVAIKVMSGPMATDPSLLERFQREARAVAALGHPHIVQVTDFQDNPGEPPFLVMERLVGEAFGDLLERVHYVEPPRVARIAEQTLSALAAAHEAGLVHRDVKPDNVFLCTTDTGADLVKLLDFGVAKVLEERAGGKLTSTGAVVGTLAYMAPEQARGEAVDARADVYAVGACMYHALAGRPPFEATTTAQLLSSVCHEAPPPLGALRPDVDGQLIGVVERAMARDVGARYRSARAMMSALGAYLRGDPQPTDPMSATAFASAPVPSPRVISGPVRMRGEEYEHARTGVSSPFSGQPAPLTPPPPTTGPGLTPSAAPPTPQNMGSVPAPYPPPMHPGSGGGVVVPPYGLAPSLQPQRRSSFGVLVGSLLLLAVGAGAAAGAVILKRARASTAVAATANTTVSPPKPVSLVDVAGSAAEIATLSPTGTGSGPHALPTPTSPLGINTGPSNAGGAGTTPQSINTPPPPNLNGSSTAQLVNAMVKAHTAGDGRTCLDAYEKLKQTPDFSADPYTFMHGDCLMAAGRCDEGRRELRAYFNQPKPALQQMSSDQVDATVSNMAKTYCPVSQLSATERVERAQILLYKAQGSKDVAGAARYADEMATYMPQLPRATEDERRKLQGYEYAVAHAYGEAGRCEDAKRHFHNQCSTSSPTAVDACANGLLGSTACGKHP